MEWSAGATQSWVGRRIETQALKGRHKIYIAHSGLADLFGLSQGYAQRFTLGYSIASRWDLKQIMNDSYQEFLTSVSHLAASINDMHQLAVQQITPLVHDILRSRSRDARRIEHTLDRLLDHCDYDPALLLYKKLCRYYFEIDPAATVGYINAYREMWDSEPEEETMNERMEKGG